MPPEERRTPEAWDWLMEVAVATVIFLIALALLGYYLLWGYDWYQTILERLYALWELIRPVMMVIALLVSIGLLGFIVVIFRRFVALSPRLPLVIIRAKGAALVAKAIPLEKEVSNEWQEVMKLMDSQNSSDWNMSVLRADALLDDALQFLGHEGKTVRERLERVDPTMVSSLDRVLSSHRLRNVIAHDPTVQYSRETIIQALRSYEQGLKELGVLRE